MSEIIYRSLLKTISWRILGTSITFGISWVVTGNFTIAGSIALIQLFFNTIFYFIHERIWNRISWGKNI
jgi:uncharacterized membrane protein